MLIDYPMVQDDLLRMRVEFEAGAPLAFEAAITFDETQQSGTPHLAAIVDGAGEISYGRVCHPAARAALELIGGNGYTSDYPVARLLRDAQVLTVWEGPANIQALELLRLLGPRYRGWEQYQSRVRTLHEKLPTAQDNLRVALQTRLAGDREAVSVSIRDPQSGERYARKLLHRLSQEPGVCTVMRSRGERIHAGSQRLALF